MSWEQIVDEAGGQKLYWYMWGGSDLINRFVNGYVAERLKNEYDIALEMVPVTDATTFVNKALPSLFNFSWLKPGAEPAYLVQLQASARRPVPPLIFSFYCTNSLRGISCQQPQS